MTEQRTLEIDGKKTYTEAMGAASQPAVLLVSGAGAPGFFWTDSFCQRLVDNGFFVIRYDHRDIGFSDSSDDFYELSDLASDAIEILNSYNLQAAHIVGHSMGGYMAQILAANYPERLLSLTIISAGPVGLTSTLLKPQSVEERETLHETWRIMMRNRPTQDFEESFEGYRVVWRRLNGATDFNEQKAKSYTEALYTRSRHKVGFHEKHVKVMEKVAKDIGNQKDVFSKIKAPTLIIHGAEDYLVMPERGGEALAEVLPQAQLEVIPKMGHMFFNEEIEQQLADHIITFIQSR